MKNPRLSVQLFLGLMLMVIVSMPNGIEGLKCLICEQRPSTEECKTSFECNGGACVKVVYDGGDVGRLCYSAEYINGASMGCRTVYAEGSKAKATECLCNDKGDCNPAGRSTSNGKLILAIMMIPAVYYGYICGGGGGPTAL